MIPTISPIIVNGVDSVEHPITPATSIRITKPAIVFKSNPPSAFYLEPELPMTLPVLKAALFYLHPDTLPDDLAVYAACCVTYYGCLRGSEFTSVNGDFDASHHISRRDVTFTPTFDDATCIILKFPFYKPTAHSDIYSIKISAVPGDSSCPVAALKRHFAAGSDREGALFKCADGSPLTTSYFTNTLQDAIVEAGLEPVGFDVNSFR